MKKHFLLIICFFFCVSADFFAQDQYPVKKVNGTDYYIYTVEASEGLYAVGRKFGISPDEISKSNPEVKNGLKAGQVLFIPVEKAKVKNPVKKAETTAPKTTVKNNAEPVVQDTKVVTETPQEKESTEELLEFEEYVVKSKQTLFGICRKFDVNQEDVLKYNPKIANGLQEGDTLRIPKYKKVEKKKFLFWTIGEKTAEKKDHQSISNNDGNTNGYITYTVEEKETLYSIAKRYGVTVDELKQLNPDAKDKVKRGAVLKIPVKKQKKEFKRSAVDEAFVCPVKTEDKLYRIAFLLPFMLNDGTLNETNEKFVDFYCGSLMALNDAKQEGISTEVFTYDTEKSIAGLNSILSNPDLKNVDLIVGPAYSDMLLPVENFARANKIKTLIPFSSKAETDLNPYVFQFNPGDDAEVSFLADVLCGKYQNANIVFVNVAGIAESDDGFQFSANLKADLKNRQRKYSQVFLNGNENSYSDKLSSDVPNIMIFNTDKYDNASAYLKKLTEISNTFDVRVFRQNSWNNKTIDQLSTLSVSPFKRETGSEAVQKFNTRFRINYKRDINPGLFRYDLLGYDLTRYFVRLMSNGNRNTTKNTETDGMQSDFKFERSGAASGFVNKQLYLHETKRNE